MGNGVTDASVVTMLVGDAVVALSGIQLHMSYSPFVRVGRADETCGRDKIKNKITKT